MSDEPERRLYICCVCRPQYVNGPPTGPSVRVMAKGATDAALRALAEAEWNDPGYIEVIVYMSPEEDHPNRGSRWRVRVALEPER